MDGKLVMKETSRLMPLTPISGKPSLQASSQSYVVDFSDQNELHAAATTTTTATPVTNYDFILNTFRRFGKIGISGCGFVLGKGLSLATSPTTPFGIPTGIALMTKLSYESSDNSESRCKHMSKLMAFTGIAATFGYFADLSGLSMTAMTNGNTGTIDHDTGI